MVSLWEPVGGVFWSAPPVVAPDEGWAYWPTILVLLALVIASLIVWQRIRAKRQQPDWNLRQHITEIGTALTAVYLFGMLVLICARGGQVLIMPLNEVGDFLAGVFGPVAFLWLVLGFLQQGEELRQNTKALELQGNELKLSSEALLMQAEELKNSVEQQTIMATAAIEQRDALRVASEVERKKREQEVKVIFSMRTLSSGATGAGGTVMNEIRISNDGHHAYNVVLHLEAPILDCEAVRIGHVKANSSETLKVFLIRSIGSTPGKAILRYEDADGNDKTESFDYLISNSRVEFGIL